MVCSSSRVSNTRRRPNSRCRPRVTPYTPPLAATSSPKSERAGNGGEDLPEAVVDGLGCGARTRRNTGTGDLAGLCSHRDRVVPAQRRHDRRDVVELRCVLDFPRQLARARP